MDEAIIRVILFHLKTAVGLIGIVVIVIGAIMSIPAIWTALATQLQPSALNEIRKTFAFYITLGLEFLLASDIIMTIMAPDYYTLGLLGGLVVIRTVLSLSLDRDIREG